MATGGAPRAGLILQHSDQGLPGRLGEWLRARGIPFSVHRSWETPPDLDPRAYGFVASLGSVRSVNDAEPPWIPTEVAFLGRCVEAGTPVLGLCWGAQALARALGATVGPAPVAEKGWVEVRSEDPMIAPGPWLYYHTESFTIPAGADGLGHSPGGPAGFRLGPHLGVQFHPEAGAQDAARWALHDPEQTDASRRALAAQAQRWDAGAARAAPALFDAWWATTGASRALSA